MTASHNDSLNSHDEASLKLDEDHADHIDTGEDTVSSLMKRILVRSLVLLGIAGVVGGVVGWFLAGGHGVLSAVVAFGILLIFCLVTPAAFAVLSRGSIAFTTLVTGLVVSWIAKIVVVIAALLVLRSATWFDHRLFAIYVVVGAVVVLAVEAHAVLTSRFPYTHSQR